MSEEQKNIVSKEQEEEVESQTTEQGDEENKKDQKRKQHRVKVKEISRMHSYFWGSLKAMATIAISDFTISGFRIVQEENEEEIRIYPPQGWVGNGQKSLVKIHNKELWESICEEISKAYILRLEQLKNKRLENNQKKVA